MATHTARAQVQFGLFDSRIRRRFKIWRLLFVFVAVLVATVPVHAQWQQPFVFSNVSGISVFTRNDATGVLTPLNGSPFASKEPVQSFALDFKGRFVFTANQTASKISIFTVAANTGTVQEVVNLPFSVGTMNQPIFMATEITGQYVFAVNLIGAIPGESSIDVLQIDPAQTLNPIQNFELPAPVVAAANDPRGHAFYVYLGFNSQIGLNYTSVQSYSFNPATGTLEQTSTAPGGNRTHSLVVNPQGTFLVAGHGEFDGQLDSASISAADGALSSPNNTALLGSGNFPFDLVLDSIGKFLYSTIFNQVHLYLAPSLVDSPSSPLPTFTTSSGWLADPTGAFIYFDKTYQVDSKTDVLGVAQATNFPLGNAAAFNRPPSQQPIVGPVAILNPSFLSFGSLTIGQTSNTQVIHIVSNGDQALSLNSVTVTGTNASEFPETDDCHAQNVLQPGKFCTVQVTFTPTAAGNRSASLTITDNASPNTLSAPLTGTGLTPAPAVTLVPGSLDFGTQAEGTTRQTQTVTLTNSGTAPLQIFGVSLGGANNNDFAETSMCAGSIPVGGPCKISASFSPLALGLRTSTIGIADNAPNATQTITIGGNGSPTIVPSGTTSQTVTAGQTANYALQLTPGAGFTGTVSLACSGAPVGAMCSVPASVQVTNLTPASFNVTVTTSGPSGAILPYLNRPRFTPSTNGRVLPLLTLFAIVLLTLVFRASQFGVKRLAWSGAFAMIVMFAVFSVAGCGAGSSASGPPPVVTPQGTFTITVTPSAMSGKPLQLTPILLTLKVK